MLPFPPEGFIPLQSPRRPSLWVCRDHIIPLGTRTLVMGILNVTPDSFSDGGCFIEPPKAIAHAERMVEEGADLIDIGAVSTRPGSQSVPVEDECRRLLLIVEELCQRLSVPISIDTSSSQVAKTCLDLGISIINDITALRTDPAIADLAATTGAGLVLMHSRGTPQTMSLLTDYENVCLDVCRELQSGIDISLNRGVKREQLVVDPGIGFAKTAEQNLTILRYLPQMLQLELPILVGTSRKSFLGFVTGRPVNERLAATGASVAMAILGGASIVRVHDVREMRDVARVVDAVLSS